MGGAGVCRGCSPAAPRCRPQTTSAKALLLYLWRFQSVLGGSLASADGRQVSASSRFIYGVVVNRTPLFPPPERAGCLHARTGGKFSLHVVLLTQLNVAQMGISIQPVSKHVIVRKVLLVTASAVAAAHRGMTKHSFRVI